MMQFGGWAEVTIYPAPNTGHTWYQLHCDGKKLDFVPGY